MVGRRAALARLLDSLVAFHFIVLVAVRWWRSLRSVTAAATLSHLDTVFNRVVVTVALRLVMVVVS